MIVFLFFRPCPYLSGIGISYNFLTYAVIVFPFFTGRNFHKNRADLSDAIFFRKKNHLICFQGPLSIQQQFRRHPVRNCYREIITAMLFHHSQPFRVSCQHFKVCHHLHTASFIL